ncbi:hypothetical protein ZWY2020_047760 [Hordeum vulgare]|nr:hypothetical protein ZWY2020_047760 [Hordeum vulgare]
MLAWSSPTAQPGANEHPYIFSACKERSLLNLKPGIPFPSQARALVHGVSTVKVPLKCEPWSDLADNRWVEDVESAMDYTPEDAATNESAYQYC